LEHEDTVSVSDLEEQLRVMKIRYNQLENKLENEKIRRIDGGGVSESRAKELQDENARLLKVEEEQMILILDMETQIDRLIDTIKNT
jgi:ABC-type phosphate transport system auxiliary subunit